MKMIRSNEESAGNQNLKMSKKVNGGVSRGRRGRFRDGPVEFWVCPYCGQRVSYEVGTPYFKMACPNCGELMIPE